MVDRIVIFTEGKSGPFCGLDEKLISRAGGRLLFTEARDEAERIKMAQVAEVLIAGNAPITRGFLSALRQLKGVVRAGIGLDAVDLAVATELGIIVANVPDFCREEVAEHTLGLILAVARKIVLADRRVRQGQWHGLVEKEIFPIYRLSGRTLGLIGLGNIGSAVAQKAQALGLRVIAFDPYLSEESAAAINVKLQSFDELLYQADIVSLHVPLTSETRHMINALALARMKSGSLLINVGRGALVDELALQAALQTGQLLGVGLDVLEHEPPLASHPLFRFENVVFTSHFGSCSIEAYADLRRQISEQVGEILRGEIPHHLVNAELMSQPQCRLVNGRNKA